MANPELVQVMDYILNRCDEMEIEAVAAAVVRRRRDLTLFGGMGKIPDPGKAAKEILSQVNIGASFEGVRSTVRSLAEGIIRREAPDLPEEAISALGRIYVPEHEKESEDSKPPADLLRTMIDQFVAFSLGRMGKGENEKLRSKMGPWPERYWKSFPQVIRLIISDYLKDECTKEEFQTRLETALAMNAPARHLPKAPKMV